MRIKPSLVLIITLFAAVAHPLSATELVIARSENTLYLRWPQATGNCFYLQSTTNLQAPAAWSNAGEPTTNGADLVVTGSTTTPQRFYRLKAWEILFDGTSTAAFRGYQHTNLPSDIAWAVTTNGELETLTNGNPINIITTNQYADFELVWEWKTPTKGNSGVNYRCTEEYANSEWSGPEFQLLDDRSYSSTGLGATAAVWGLLAPTNNVLAPTGQWNQCRLIVQGNYVEHWLNGRRVLVYNLNSAAFNSIVAASSTFNKYPHFGKARTGYIAFRHDGTQSWFRDIRIRPLP